MAISFSERYRSKNTPWEINRPDEGVVKFIESGLVEPCPALDIGCGSGNNAIWLAGQGFQVTGIDRTKLALAQARQKDEEDLCHFIQADYLSKTIPGAPFAFIMDRGCFHHFRTTEERAAFARKTAEIMAPAGVWLSLIGNRDETREGPGPPKLSATEICQAVEPFFIIQSLNASHFDSDQVPRARNWICHMEKR
ncbi:MAG: class I SAM-dependent methyltransferase [Thermodesulfobacteriota bacterium]